MSAREGAVVRVVSSIADVPAETWDACAGNTCETEPGHPANPFLTHAFLSALETTGCVRAETGWLPQHLVLEDASGTVRGCMPLYLKSHSQGEYVFDHGWAEAYERAGGDYYPKLQSAVPFTPVTGTRALVPDGPDAGTYAKALFGAACALAGRNAISSVHWTFLTEPEWALGQEMGLLARTDQQFHWFNEGYGSFDDFLGSLASRKRKNIRKERRQADALGLDIAWLTGSEITEAHWDAFFGFYMDTGARKWGRPYLNRAFFSAVGKTMGDDILLVLCLRDDQPIAGALNFIGADCLYGRYWGCVEDHPFLHFETCYYQAIDYAIAHGLPRVEAGAQGPHKLARGYLPRTTYSLHHIADPGLERAVADYLKRERAYVEMENQELEARSPYRKGGGTGDAPQT